MGFSRSPASLALANMAGPPILSGAGGFGSAGGRVAATIPSKPCSSDVDCAEVQQDYNDGGTGRSFCSDKARKTYVKYGYFAAVQCLRMCSLAYALCMGGDDIKDDLASDPVIK